MESDIIGFLSLFFSLSAFVLATIVYFKVMPRTTKDIKEKRDKLKNEDFSKKKKDDEPADIDTKEFNPFE
ncbi:MAG: hypothetical protein KAJ47_03035 [Candidatus Aenigmarchaeota archaeon]|nr:hypothetical protein [Candidatus Aenigmarchaeota archaeon]